MVSIAVINESTLVSNADVATMVAAIQIQIDLHFAPAWGVLPAKVSFFADKTKVPGYYWLMSVIDSDAQAVGALGYHEEDADRPDGFIMAEPILSNGGAVMVFDPSNPTQYTVSATLSHETLEILGDRFANSFSVGPQISQGNLYCIEMADAVESLSYFVNVGSTEVSVSNFLFPSYFNPEATAAKNMPFDYLKQLSAPFTMASGGYMIVATFSNEGQVTAEHIFDPACPQWRRDYVKGEFYRR